MFVLRHTIPPLACPPAVTAPSIPLGFARRLCTDVSESTRRLRRSIWARPPICRLRLVSRLLCPSTGPVLHGHVTPACPAASASRRLLAPRAHAWTVLVAARSSQAARGAGCRWRPSTAPACVSVLASATSPSWACHWARGGCSSASRGSSRRSTQHVAPRGVSGVAASTIVAACAAAAPEDTRRGAARLRPTYAATLLSWPRKPGAVLARHRCAPVRPPAFQRSRTEAVNRGSNVERRRWRGGRSGNGGARSNRWTVRRAPPLWAAIARGDHPCRCQALPCA
jgi:hypothetical protein